MNKFLSLLAFISLISNPAIAQRDITGFFTKNIEKQISLEQQFDKNLDKDNIGEFIKLFSSKPHHLNSPADKENADYLVSQFKKYGWDAEIEPLRSISTPKKDTGTCFTVKI